ncbi:MAG TPA: ACP S-malonyltransferase [Pseudomonadales bacterium]|nr:ACP S-malonyltransferase [Pseudomonadales bacterium]
MNSRLAFVFSGQGSQKVGMLAEVGSLFPVVKNTFSEASEVLGYDLWDLCQNGEQEQLNLTETTQPLLLTSSVALWRVWQEKNGANPALLAGHSLGEWSALVCSGVVAFADAVDLVRKRGAYMQTAVPKGEGSMAAVLNLEDAIILDICKQASVVGVVEAVNFNSPGQVVIAGQVAAVDKASELLKAVGAKRVLPLPVSAPFHTSLMQPAAEQMAGHINATVFNAPEIPVIHNVHARMESDPEVIKQLMIKQIDSPVLWVDCINALVANGISSVIECGPGKVLCGLCAKIEKSLNTYSLEDMASIEKALSETRA